MKKIKWKHDPRDEKYYDKDGNMDFSKAPKTEIEDRDMTLEEFKLLFNHGLNDEFDKKTAHIMNCLMLFHAHVRGMSTRELSRINGLDLSHTTIADKIREGREYFNRFYALINKISDDIKEFKYEHADLLPGIFLLRMRMYGFLEFEDDENAEK